MAYYPLTYPATYIPDVWHTTVLDRDGNVLGRFDATLDYELVETTMLDVSPGSYQKSGAVEVVRVYKNGVLYANITSHSFRAVLINQTEYGGQLIVQATDRVSMGLAKVEPVCTCGGWVTYGKEADLHADNLVIQCDLRRKP